MFTNVIYGFPGDEKLTYSYRHVPLGTKLILPDGREFRFALNGASAGAQGKLAQAAAVVTNHVGQTVAAAAAVGDRTVSLTLGATALTADQYRDGFLVIEDSAGTGFGAVYSIDTHDAVGSAGTFVCPLQGKITKALTTSSKYSLIKNPYDSIVIHPSPPTAAMAGVWQTDLAAAAYGWVQTRGVASLLQQGAWTAGVVLAASASVDGAVAAYALTEGTPNTGADQVIVGRAIRNVGDAKYGIAELTLA
jgi:hypothetical protein